MTVTCHLCGRQFGRRSLSIHVAACQQRWAREQHEQQQVRSLPPPPRGWAEALSGALVGSDLRRYNRRAVLQWQDTVLAACPACGRTFLPGQLRKHQGGCREDRPMDNPHRADRPMDNPHRGAGRATSLARGVTYPSEKTDSLQAVRQEQGKELEKVDGSRQPLERQATYCISPASPVVPPLVPWYRLTSERDIQSSLKEFITTIRANSAIFDRQLNTELLEMTQLLQNQSSRGSREERQEEKMTEDDRKMAEKARHKKDNVSDKVGAGRLSEEEKGWLRGEMVGRIEGRSGGGGRGQGRREAGGSGRKEGGGSGRVEGEWRKEPSALPYQDGLNNSFTYCSRPNAVY